MAIRKMTDNNNGHKKGQTITMVKVKMTDNNNGHKKNDRPLLLSVLFILTIVIVCPFYFGHSYCLSFF
jgi:hypothetical protein